MLQSIGGLLGLAASLLTIPAASLAAGWEVERDVEAPSYAMTSPAVSNLNIDTVVLSCEQGPSRRGLQLRLYLSNGPLAPRGAGELKDDPSVEIAIDGVSHRAGLLFADDFVVVADSEDGRMPLLSESLVDSLQAGHRLELRFDLVREARGQSASVDGTAAVDLQAAAVATVRRCAGEAGPQVAEKAGR